MRAHATKQLKSNTRQFKAAACRPGPRSVAEPGQVSKVARGAMRNWRSIFPKTCNIISATLSSHYFPHARHHGQVLRNFQRTRQNDILQGKLFIIIFLPEMHGICRMCATLSEGKDGKGNRSAKFVSPACALHQSFASSRLKFQIILLCGGRHGISSFLARFCRMESKFCCA